MKCTLEEWQKIFKNPKDLIIQASALDGIDSWQSHSIGMSYNYVHVYSVGKDLQVGSHSNTVCCAIHEGTDQSRRGSQSITRRSIIETLKKNNIYNTMLHYIIYYESLPNYKFVISPEGNGIDCHRHYEALIAGCIPIMEDNELIRIKYKDMPVLYTKDYSEITGDYLLEIYNTMMKTSYDFSKLFLNSYSDDEIKLIKRQSDGWCNHLTGTVFYM